MTRPSSFDFDQSRADPLRAEHLPDHLPADPMGLVAEWFNEARRRAVQPNPNAMTLATVDDQGRPQARIVLCKQLEPESAAVVFYTNYESRKAAALDARHEAALLFHWDALDRQVRIEGPVVRVSAVESDAYFASRPWESRVGAWASDQSRPIGSRAEMRERVAAAMRRFGLDPASPPREGQEVHIPRPPRWGGYRVYARRVELWISGPGRVHDRAEWERPVTPGVGSEPFALGPWRATRLQP